MGDEVVAREPGHRVGDRLVSESPHPAQVRGALCDEERRGVGPVRRAAIVLRTISSVLPPPAGAGSDSQVCRWASPASVTA
jgi:hypothetical protein